MSLRATILGCGPSYGVPRIGGIWGACDPNEPKNRRTRCSLIVEQFGESPDSTAILVDTGPDLREQLLAAEVRRIDAVLYTHPHADHLHGIDDLRAFAMDTRRRVEVYADAHTAERLLEAFGYCFKAPPGSSYPPILNLHRIEAGRPLAIDGPGGPLEILPFRQIHGDISSLGLRFGNLAYSCDVSDFPPESVPALADLDLWILDALRYVPHPSHLSVSEALQWIARIAPKRAVLTHMLNDLDYQTLKRELPQGVEPGYDGMVFDL
ncbi:MAG: MBL fold metallo-hydrolase [Rhizobiales bacterium]|nr:MBL fold metallo-hydrolase [Hyphomicrobiales bacterium]